MVKIKIVPNATPNADGKWLVIDAKMPDTRGWVNSVEHFAPHVPEGYHLVAVEHRDDPVRLSVPPFDGVL